MDRVGVGDIRDGDGDGLNWWGDNVSYVTLGTDPNYPLAYAPVLELHHPIMSKLWDPRGRLEIEIEIERQRETNTYNSQQNQ